MTQNEKDADRTFREGDRVVVTELTDLMVEQDADVDGEVGRVDVIANDGRYLVLFPGARGWYIPEENLREPTDEEKSEWRQPW